MPRPHAVYPDPNQPVTPPRRARGLNPWRATWQLASPLVATVGLSLSIPLAMASDVLRQRVRLTPTMVLGALAVWAGFLLVSGAKQLRRRMVKLCPGCIGVAPALPAPRETALHRVTHPLPEAEP